MGKPLALHCQSVITYCIKTSYNIFKKPAMAIVPQILDNILP